MTRVTLQPSGHEIKLLPGETILAAAQRLGFDVPQSCRNGNCHVCAANLVSGRARQGDTVVETGELYTCITRPLDDCTLHWENVLAPNELPLRSLACQVVDCIDLGADVWQVKLRTPAGKPLRHHAGQYLLLERDDGESSAFSIASAPNDDRELELQILAREQSAIALVEHLRRNRIARVKIPLGDCHVAQLPQRSLILIAAGTGLAQMQSIIENCLARGFDRAIHLYWGVREAADFYQAPFWESWATRPNLYLHQVVSDDAAWPGRQGLLPQAVSADLSSLGDYEVFVSGSPPMVYATLDSLVAAGMPEQNMHADVFAYAPREALGE
ncbi:2Fe-2S iron-sulfur cluster binding domain-containing protein [Halopseudomonas nanhaiensis]|uniref:2Fe-2S iron-sulfur cluster-binding protein n=1 Tax=Halopseudomonas nanhaiensis TaxID=2830842 RepID=UPI001CBDA898|nr:2Fe-2S iron-sulfur cluster-binding protein [Halopseudomonas nanhaiensis]UAW98593.1 2Fe-2S iron-sulfur cluster binding domain-containing protein [Halopseudomonas nanhaiensis]